MELTEAANVRNIEQKKTRKMKTRKKNGTNAAKQIHIWLPPEIECLQNKMAQKISLAQTTAHGAYEIRFGADFWLCLFFTLRILFSLALSRNFLFFGVMQAKHFSFLFALFLSAEALSLVFVENWMKLREQKKTQHFYTFV